MVGSGVGVELGVADCFFVVDGIDSVELSLVVSSVLSLVLSSLELDGCIEEIVDGSGDDETEEVEGAS